ncbi:lipoprotein [Paractinoplanes rishiriensis]|uniref:lipoprotein n=1 Tax=Paractinoplanes rishiriensis TaxID=1050105 RepID=UPI0019428712|nr:lipoprotein [Actinoplanes rishiriensis]
MRIGKIVAGVLTSTVALALTACGGSGAATAPPAPAPGGPRVGAAGSGCELPVTFTLEESYQPKTVSIAPDDPLAELAKKGPVTMVCEIDAKPAGNIGFLRVYAGDKAELRTSLEAFIGKGALEPAFTDLRIGDRAAVEVVYQQKSPLDDGEVDKERAFVVETAQGIVVVALDSFDSDEHESILPAYELAKSTLA